MSTAHRPDGYSTLTPMICVSPAAEAISFYQKVFGATVCSRMDGPDGSVWHCELQLEQGRLQVMDPNEAFSMVTGTPDQDRTTFSLAIYVEDVDATVARARVEGATVREEVADFEVTGDRFGSIRDPFGVRWSVMARTTPRTDAEIQQGLDAWAASMGEQA